jgi:SAM-dependent MidA family methyltransferase
MTEAQVEKFLTIQQAQLAMMMGIYQNLQILCEKNGSESATFNWRDVHSLLETGKHELEET